MRYRFVDRVLRVDAQGEGTIATVKTFPRTEDYFDGIIRYPHEVPSSLLLESMAFAGALLLCIRSNYTTQGILLKVNRATFPSPVVAGDQVTVRSRLVAIQGSWTSEPGRQQDVGMAQMLAQCFVGGNQVAEADILFLGVPLEKTLGSHMEEIVASVRDLVTQAESGEA